MQQQPPVGRRTALVQGVQPGHTSDADGPARVAVDGHTECPVTAQYQVHLLGVEAKLKLGPGAGRGFLGMLG